MGKRFTVRFWIMNLLLRRQRLLNLKEFQSKKLRRLKKWIQEGLIVSYAIIQVKLLLLGFNCVLASTFFNIEENFCAIIADDDNKRADLNVLGNKEKDKFIEFAPGEEIEIKKGFVVIEGKINACM
ncbi:unnamed protein product [Meloidogyne enterolobii]|uniref:Uncharacterized protein n=1 Tax=Meloidogyne enterolobii TaxID=390850 RepID=A0ACB0Y322_MELEN